MNQFNDLPPKQNLPPNAATEWTAGAGTSLVQKIVNQQGEVLGSIQIEPDLQLLIGHWQCDANPENIAVGLNAALEIVQHFRCRAIISNGTEGTGDWSDMLPWLQYQMLPDLLRHGIQFVANVSSSDPGGRLAHQKLAQQAAGILTLRLFDNLASARAWLEPLLKTAA
jgi:hypothetical protein